MFDFNFFSQFYNCIHSQQFVQKVMMFFFFLFRNSAKTYPERNFVGTRAFLPDGKRGAYEWITYAQARERWVNLASGLRELGLKKVYLLTFYLHAWE